MKLRLPSLLCSALLACMACASSVYADTYLTEGVTVTEVRNDGSTNYETYAFLSSDTNRFYDGGKGTYWSSFSSAADELTGNGSDLSALGDLSSRVTTSDGSVNFENLSKDDGQCWAYTSSNLLQYWQSYYGVFAQKARTNSQNTPVHGYTYDKAHLNTLGGTQSLKLNLTFYDNWANMGGDSQTALAWYLGGQVLAPSRMKEGYEAGGYFADYFTYTGKNDASGNDYSTCYFADTSLAKFSSDIKTLFGQDDGTKGQIVHLDLTSTTSSGHAITCYGYETDADGNIIAVYIANSDDQSQSMRKLTVKWEQMRLTNGMTVTGAVLYDGSLKWNYAGKNWRITSMNAIDTPEVLKTMLAEYETGKLTWMGNLESWTNTSSEADPNVLPTDATGWMTYAGSGTEHAGYYNSYYSTGRGVEFNDEATSGTVNVGEDISVSSMVVNNSRLDYTFRGEGQTITADSLSKTGAGALEFTGVKLVANAANLEGDATFDQLHLNGDGADGTQGILKINGNTATLKGDASFHLIDTGTSDHATGTSTLVISGGTTKLRTSGAWTNLQSLEISDEARLDTNASICVSGNITTAAVSTGTLADGKDGITAAYCVYVGSMEGGSVKEGTGNVTLAGDITAGAYIKILGNANIGGDLKATGSGTEHVIEIGGDADIGGTLSARRDATIGGNATLGSNASVGGKLTVGGNLTGKSTGENIVVTASGSMVLGGDVSHVDVKTGELTLAAGATLDSVNIEVQRNNGSLTLTQVVVRGDSSFSSYSGTLTLNAVDVTIVLDDSNSLGGRFADTPENTPMPLSVATDAEDYNPQPSYTIVSTMLEGVSLSGSVTLDISHWAEEIEASGFDTVNLLLADEVDFADGTTVQVYDGQRYATATYTGNSLQFKSIPEPTTATLSLLALGALAARRRRR